MTGSVAYIITAAWNDGECRMTFKRIDESTIRCIVTEEDMEENGLELDDFFTQSDKAQDFLREVVEQASEEVGYESRQGMVSLQIMPLPNHALAITFSDSDESKEWQNMVENIKGILEEVKERVKEKGTLQDGDAGEKPEEVSAVTIPAGAAKEWKVSRAKREAVKVRLFAFVNLRFAIQYARTVQEKGAVHSTLYKDVQNNVFYMTLEKGRLSTHKYNVLCSNATEFATYIADGQQLLGYLKEHGEVLVENRAVKVLAKL